MENLQQFIADAEAEHLAKRVGLRPNPWAGAGARLAAAESAQRAEQERAEREAAERAEEQRAAAFVQAIASRASLYDEMREADVRASEIEREFQAPAMLAAGQTYDDFQKWRQTNTYARDAELVYRSMGTYPPDHYLASVSPQRIATMRGYADLLKRREREQNVRGTIESHLAQLLTQWPALRNLPVDEAVAA